MNKTATDRTISWTAISTVSKYKYVISEGGNVVASGDKVTDANTASLNSILTGRQTFSISVSGYGSQDGNTFYLPVSSILTQTFYSFKLEVTREFENNLTEVYYTVNVTPDDYTASAPKVNLHAYTNSVNYSHSGDTQLTDKVRTDLTSFIDTNVLPEGGNFGSDRHAYLTFTVVNNEDYFIANNKAFLVGDSDNGNLGKHHDTTHDTYNYMVS